MTETATQAVNALRLDLFGIASGTIFHAAADTPIATATATDLPSLLGLVNAIVASFDAHVANVVNGSTGVGIHGVPSGDAVTLGGGAVDLGTAVGLLTLVNRAFRVHAGSTPAHFAPDRLPAFQFVPTDISLVSAVCDWANAMKVAMNLHFASAMQSGVAT